MSKYNCDNCGKPLTKNNKIEVTWQTGTKVRYHVRCYDETAQDYATSRWTMSEKEPEIMGLFNVAQRIEMYKRVQTLLKRDLEWLDRVPQTRKVKQLKQRLRRVLQ